ncbi:MAG TPA: TlpA family protein disulfide reductase, partial [Clostridiales bacterium]|nr:TlpA family protein disulfide reductase [Clostridiales bacterium]
MPRALAVLVVLTVALLSGCRPGPANDRAPDFRLPNLAGEQVSLRRMLQDGPVLVNFWATWCPPCKRKLPELEELHREFAGRGLTIAGINLDADPGDARAFLAAQPVSFPILFDAGGTVAAAFEVRGIPAGVLVGRDGVILLRVVGHS